MIKLLSFKVVLVAVGVFFVASIVWMQAGQATSADWAQIEDDDLAGVVTGPNGPEAGVWVIAETTALSTNYRKIVVTDDHGRYLVPDLPEVSFSVWVRGYGLVDSDPVSASPGNLLNLRVDAAPNPRAAAAVYPANYWYSLVEVPAEGEFPGTGPQGNGISPAMRNQQDWINEMKQGCQLCHQLGNPITRQLDHLGSSFDSSVDVWDERVQFGQRGGNMSGRLSRFGRQRALTMYADWTDRIAAGEVPPAPPRPKGAERNLVLTMWEWAGPYGYVHDEVTTDKRDPMVNANGPVYGVDYGGDGLVIVDPTGHEANVVAVPTRDAGIPSQFPQTMPEASPFWGDELIFNNPASIHNPMMDHLGRVWMTSRIRERANPDFCKEGSDNPYAQRFPIEEAGRQLSFYDPETKKVTLVDTCFNTHHLQFGEDDDNTLFVNSPGGNGIGWLNTRVFDDTGDSGAAQGWCPPVIDTNGDGVIGEYVGVDQPVDPSKDKRIGGSAYGLIPNPVDGSIWYTFPGAPGAIVRLDRGTNPPSTCISEVFEPPFNNPNAPGEMGYSPRGIDVDRNGVIWTALAGSGHMASFDRSKCSVLNGPTATGQHCPEGWTLYQTPGPQMKGVTQAGTADFHYFNWVDQFNTLGLGSNIPIANGSGSDSLVALLPETEEFVILRVPYPLGFYSRGLDGRIDDPSAGWKGRGLWANYGTNAAWHIEGGKGTQGAIVKFQLRPDPLAN